MYTFSFLCNGLAKVLSGLTGGPGKVRFKKNSQIGCTLAKSGLGKGMRFSEAGGRFLHGHISRVTCFFPSFFRGPVAEGPPEHCGEKTWVKNGLDGVFAVSAFLVIFVPTFLRQKSRRYTFPRPSLPSGHSSEKMA